MDVSDAVMSSRLGCVRELEERTTTMKAPQKPKSACECCGRIVDPNRIDPIEGFDCAERFMRTETMSLHAEAKTLGEALEASAGTYFEVHLDHPSWGANYLEGVASNWLAKSGCAQLRVNETEEGGTRVLGWVWLPLDCRIHFTGCGEDIVAYVPCDSIDFETLLEGMLLHEEGLAISRERHPREW